MFERSAFVARPWQAPLTEVTRQAFAESENHERVLKRKLRFNDMHNHFRGLKRDEFDSKVPTSVLWSKRARLFENAFQALRQHCASNGNVEDELNFHALELDARSARNDIPIFDRIIILFYKWFSDFGRSMWRPIWILLCLVPIATLAVGEYIAHYIDGEKIIIAGVPNPSQSEFYIFAIRNFIPPPPVWSENMGRTWLVGLSDTAKMVMFALGTLQTLTFGILVALFLIALRRRFQIRV